jgi:hypothetical protein
MHHCGPSARSIIATGRNIVIRQWIIEHLMKSNKHLAYFFSILIVGLCISLSPSAIAKQIDCPTIQHIMADSPEGKKIEKSLIKWIKRQHDLIVRILKFRTIEQVDRWIIAEVEFDLLEPGIFVITKDNTGYRVAAVYGGVELDNSKDTIRLYFAKKLPNAPKDLFLCYAPKGAPFGDNQKLLRNHHDFYYFPSQ